MTATLPRRSPLVLLAALACCAALLLPTAARAADTYVDDDSGSDSNPCLTTAAPCMTISAAIAKTEPGYAIHVDGGFYGESMTLGGDKSLVEEEFNAADGDSQATIDGGAAKAIEVPSGDEAGAIARFTVRSDTTAIDLRGPATVAANLFDDKTESVAVNVEPGADGSVVSNNTFADGPSETDFQTGVEAINAGAATIIDNTFHHLRNAIWIANGTQTVVDNAITGTRQSTNSVGTAIAVVEAKPTIVGNEIRSPASSGITFGVSIFELAGPPSTGATLRRNEIYDHSTGVQVTDTTAPVTLDSDLIAGSSGSGLFAHDNGTDDAGVADVTATNLTAFDNNIEIYANTTHLTLDSSIVGPGGIEDFDGTCAISFSRGPLMNPGGTGCDDFQTTAPPGFVDPGADDYHLTAGSPLLDAGNPADPASGAVDLDGDPRALDATLSCSGNVARRDIGADEFVPAPPNCGAPQPTSSPPPPSPPTSQSPPSMTDASVRLWIRGRRLRLNRRGVMRLRLSCPRSEQSPPCAGTVVLRTRAKLRFGQRGSAKRRRVVLARARFELAAGSTGNLRIRLPRRKLRLVQADRRARRVLVLARVHDAAGNRATAHKRLALLPGAHRR